MPTILLSFIYWFHLLATVIWLGGLATLVLIALPAQRQQELSANQWLRLQQRLTPWINGSLVVLLITGFVQMTNDEHYAGFLVFDGTWAWALFIKHIAFVGMAGVTAYLQFGLQPEMGRVRLLSEKKPQLAVEEQTRLEGRERRLLWTNTGLAVVVLLFTAVMTAV